MRVQPTSPLGGVSDTFTVSSSTAVLIGAANFSNGSITPSALPAFPQYTWLTGVTGTVTAAVEDGALRANYPATTGDQMYLVFNCLGLTEFFVEFKAKFIDPHALKFFKVHGVDDGGGGYANSTYGLSGGGKNTQVSFGDGSTPGNDTANVIFLDGSNPSWIGRSQGIAEVYTIGQEFDEWADGQWHTYRVHHKFNTGTTSGNEVPNGVMYLEIDGVVQVNATGMLNRHYSNGPIEALVFGDIAQDNDYPVSVFFDDIKLALGTSCHEQLKFCWR